MDKKNTTWRIYFTQSYNFPNLAFAIMGQMAKNGRKTILIMEKEKV